MHEEHSQPALLSNIRALLREVLLLRGHDDAEIDKILGLLDNPEAQAELEEILMESFSRAVENLLTKPAQSGESADA